MSAGVNNTMSDRLFDLCEKQLLSIIAEASSSMERVTDRTALAVKESNELSQLIRGSKAVRSAEIRLCSSMEESFNDVVVDMQFFDELSQRIEHIMEIVNLIKIESSREGFLSDPNDSEDLFNNIKNIFSIKSEFEVMRSIFPEYEELEKGSMIELF